MSIWKRFSRWIKSIFGGAISALEDPRLILEQNIRELNDQVPKMNENIATVKANVVLLQKEMRRAEREAADLTSKIKASIQASRDDLAQRYAMQLEKTRDTLDRTKEQLKYASVAYDKALQVKKAFMREKDRKIQEAKEALRAHERSKWQAKVADAMEQFEVGGMDQTHDEMISRINEDAARNEARVEMALDSFDVEALRIEEDAESIRASEIVKQFKLEMGVGGGSEAASSEKSPAVELPEQEAEQGAKTIGKQRSQTE
jgi:phage shock protein A